MHIIILDRIYRINRINMFIFHPVNPVNPVKIFIRNIPENRQIPNVFKSSHEN